MSATMFAGEAETVADRRESAFNDPRFWVSVCAVLLTLVLFAASFAINKLNSIDTNVQVIRDANTRQGEEIKSLREQVIDLKAENKQLKGEVTSAEKRQTDYNFNLSNRLKEIEMILKLKGRGDT